MAKPEWGTKHLCEGCGLKYYDMQRTPIACPSCGEKAVIVTVRSRRGRTVVKPEPKAPAATPENGSAPGENSEEENDDSVLVNDDDNNNVAAEDVGGGSGGGAESNDKDT